MVMATETIKGLGFRLTKRAGGWVILPTVKGKDWILVANYREVKLWRRLLKEVKKNGK